MSPEIAKQARTYMQNGEYEAAKTLLETLPDDPEAQTILDFLQVTIEKMQPRPYAQHIYGLEDYEQFYETLMAEWVQYEQMVRKTAGIVAFWSGLIGLLFWILFREWLRTAFFKGIVDEPYWQWGCFCLSGFGFYTLFFAVKPAVIRHQLEGTIKFRRYFYLIGQGSLAFGLFWLGDIQDVLLFTLFATVLLFLALAEALRIPKIDKRDHLREAINSIPKKKKR